MDGWYLVVVGLAMGVLATFLLPKPRAPGQRSPRRRFVIALITVAGLLNGTVLVPIVKAEHTATVTTDHLHNSIPWNGYKVYMSSPRHASSGSRGECGWEENRNGRNWNWQAHTTGSASFFARYYNTITSANPRDDGYVTNKNSSNNWGADVHIVTHTNADSPCNDTSQYLLVMYRSGNGNSTALRTQLLNKLNPVVPGSTNSWNCDTFVECNSVTAPYRAYVELFFHTSQAAVDWYQAGGGGHGVAVNEAWRYGFAVDDLLGYPR